MSFQAKKFPFYILLSVYFEKIKFSSTNDIRCLSKSLSDTSELLVTLLETKKKFFFFDFDFRHPFNNKSYNIRFI